MLTKALPVQFDNIPMTLKSLHRWCVWGYKQRGDEKTKVPYDVTMGAEARPNNPDKWNKFEDVRDIVTAQDKYAGIGFVFAKEDGLTGIDLDACRNPLTGTFDLWAQHIVGCLNSYTEVSPSGTGVKIFVQGTLPTGGKKFNLRDPEKETKTPAVEMYSDKRYFTVTGQHIPGTPTQVMKRQTELTELYQDQVEIKALRKYSSAAHDLLSKLGCEGDSEDNASLYFLMLRRGWDVDAVERRMQQTLVYREKHTTLRDGKSFLREEIERAATKVGDVSTTAKETDNTTTGVNRAKRLLVELANLDPEHITWLWKNRIPFGRLTSFEGEPGVGKSALVADILARVTNGKPFPDEDGRSMREPGKVIYFQREDGIEDTVLPRFLAAGGDKRKIAVVHTTGLSLQDIEDCIIEYQPMLVVFDPVQSFLDTKCDMNSPNQVRAALEPWAALAKEYECAWIIVRHFNKESINSKNGTPNKPRVGKGLGSVDFDGNVRSSFQMTADADEPFLIHMDHAKCNLGPKQPALFYRIESNEDYECSQIQWVGAPKPETPEEQVFSVLTVTPQQRQDIVNVARVQFPLLSETQIDRALNKLVEDGVAIKPSYGKYARAVA